MKQTAAIFTILFLFGALFLSVTLSQQTFAKSAKDSKARRDIDRAIGRAVEGKFSTVKTVNISTYAVPNEASTVYNKTSSGSLPPIITPPPPVIPPTTDTEGYKICMVGDFKDTKAWEAMMIGKGCDYRVALGDNGYSDNLNLLKKIAPDKAICGNHDSAEDQSAAIEKECLVYTGNSWWVKFGTQNLMFGFNTNTDLDKQLNAAKNLLYNTQFMSGIKNIIVVAHKGGHVPPNSHHPAEAKDFFSQLEASIPTGVKLIQVGGHNHQSSAAPAKNWYIAGSGGRSFYQCGVSTDWTFCDNKVIAFLQFTIDSKDASKITANFIDVNGKTLY